MAEVKIKQWVDMACRLGVVRDTPVARTVYERWLGQDPAAAQRVVLAAMPATTRRQPPVNIDS